MTNPTPRRDAVRSGPESHVDARSASTTGEEARDASQALSEALCEACRAIRPLDRMEPFPGGEGLYRCKDAGACRVRFRNLKNRPAGAGKDNR
jgi:hypothetical protein